MRYEQFITRDPAVCAGQPVIRGTRVPLRTILASLAEGMTDEEILRSFPSLTREAIRAVIVFAAASAEEALPRLATPGARSLRKRVSEIFRSEAVESWYGWFVVASRHKVRVRA